MLSQQVSFCVRLNPANIFAEKEVDGADEGGAENKEEDGLALLVEAKQALDQGDIPTASQKYSDALNMDLPKVAPQALAGLGTVGNRLGCRRYVVR